MSDTDHKNRLSIAHLLAWTGGIAVAITAAGGIKWLRTTATNQLYPWAYNTQLDTFDYLAAVVYGTSVVLFVFAIRSGRFWHSPGKIILMIMALMCLIDWAITIIASEIVLHSTDFREYFFGSHFTALAPRFGYLLSIPINVLILLRAKTCGLHWRLTWIAFLVFGTMMFCIMWIPGATTNLLPIWLQNWYFEVAIGQPMVAMLIAICVDVFRRAKIDWWTTVVCTLLPVAWIIHVASTFA